MTHMVHGTSARVPVEVPARSWDIDMDRRSGRIYHKGVVFTIWTGRRSQSKRGLARGTSSHCCCDRWPKTARSDHLRVVIVVVAVACVGAWWCGRAPDWELKAVGTRWSGIDTAVRRISREKLFVDQGIVICEDT